MTDDRTEAGKPAQAAEPLALRLNDGLGAMIEPTDAEDRAFWAFLIIAQVWAASDLTGWPRWLVAAPWMALAFAVRWPYWRRTWLRRDGA